MQWGLPLVLMCDHVCSALVKDRMISRLTYIEQYRGYVHYPLFDIVGPDLCRSVSGHRHLLHAPVETLQPQDFYPVKPGAAAYDMSRVCNHAHPRPRCVPVANVGYRERPHTTPRLSSPSRRDCPRIFSSWSTSMSASYSGRHF